MPIPDYQSAMLPLLRLASDGRLWRVRDAYQAIGDEFDVTEEERRELIPSGRQPLLHNRVAWAITYLVKAGLLERPKRGYFQITAAGQELIASDPPEVDSKTLEKYPSFVEFKNHTRSTGENAKASELPERSSGELAPEGRTPDDALAQAWRVLRANLESELLDEIKGASPEFFERLVIDLLVAMGYGGSRSEAGQAVGRSGDEGIDGIINEDPLGLDVIYLQAKRWGGPVGRPEIQKFAGALQGQRARKGIFITTSSFTREAREYVSHIDPRIILIDGTKLTGLMVDHDIGVSMIGAYPVKRIDSDYFVEE